MAITSFMGNYRFLSNFHLCQVYLDVDVYPSTEHAYQAAKTLSVETRDVIRRASTPGLAKRIGQKVQLRENWDQLKYAVMEDLITQKFHPDRLEAELLLKTGDELLIEGNTWGDTYWGVCRGVGENNLGKILMEQRAWLRGLGSV